MLDAWVHCKECNTSVLTHDEFDPDSSSSIAVVACPVCGRTERYDPSGLDWGELPPIPEEQDDE